MGRTREVVRTKEIDLLVLPLGFLLLRTGDLVEPTSAIHEGSHVILALNLTATIEINSS